MYHYFNKFLIFTGFKSAFIFFKDPENQHLATWIQTLAVVGGVVIALNQLDTITKQEQIKSNEKYMQLAQKYSKVVHLEFNKVLKHHSHSKSLDITEFEKRYPEGSIKKSREILQNYVEELSLCGILKVCPSKLVDSLVCSYSKELHFILKKELKRPDGKNVRTRYPFFYERKINTHCSIFDRVIHWANA